MSTAIYVKNENTFAENNYFAIKRMSKALGLFFKAHEFSDENIKSFAYNPNQFEWKSFDYPDAPRGLKELPVEDANFCARYGANLIRQLRRLRKIQGVDDNPKTIIQKSKDVSRIYAECALKECFPSMHWEIRPVMSGNFYVERERRDYGQHAWVVTVPITWHRAVNSKGLSIAAAGDGSRFIMDVKPRDLSRLTDQGIYAYEVVAVKAKNKKAEMETGWLMNYPTGSQVEMRSFETDVRAYHKEFSRCESLLRRRIRDKVTKELMGY